MDILKIIFKFYLFLLYFWLLLVFIAARAFTSCHEYGGYSLAAVLWLLITVASLVSWASAVVGLSCPTVCGIFPDQ